MPEQDQDPIQGLIESLSLVVGELVTVLDALRQQQADRVSRLASARRKIVLLRPHLEEGLQRIEDSGQPSRIRIKDNPNRS
jgi:hypothetical protein